MDDLDRLVAETMADAAGRAPSGGDLLGAVHARSRRIHRRRVAAGLFAAAALVVVVTATLLLADRPALEVPEVTPPAGPPTSITNVRGKNT